ncbi:MAG: TolC family protein [Pseudomonadota bacterium]
MFFRVLIVVAATWIVAFHHAYAQTVDDAIEAALLHNPQIDISAAETDGARAERFGAVGQLLPSISATVTASSDDLRSDELERLLREDGISYSLAFSQPVFQGGTAYHGLREANSSTSAQIWLEEESRQLVAEAAAIAHAELTRDREIVFHRARSLDLLLQQVEFTDRRREAGADNLIAVSQARSRMEQERAELVRAEAQLVVSEANYIRQTGEQPPPSLEPDTARIKDEIISSADGIAQALKLNPGLLARDDLVNAARHGKRAAQGQLAPRLSLDGQYRIYDFSDSALAPSASNQPNEFQLVARLSVPLFQNGQNYSGVKAARARLAREDAARRDARLRIEEAVTANWNILQSALLAIEAAEAAVQASEIVVEGQQAEYRSGTTNIQDVLDGQRDLVFARISLSQAEFDYRRARYSLLAIISQLVAAEE